MGAGADVYRKCVAGSGLDRVERVVGVPTMPHIVLLCGVCHFKKFCESCVP